VIEFLLLKLEFVKGKPLSLFYYYYYYYCYDDDVDFVFARGLGRKS